MEANHSGNLDICKIEFPPGKG